MSDVDQASFQVGLAEAEEREIELTGKLKVVAVNPSVVRDSAHSWMPPPTRSVYYPAENSILSGQCINRTIITKADAKGRAKETIQRLEGNLCPSVSAVIYQGQIDKRVLVGTTASLCKCDNCVDQAEYSGGTYWVDARLINLKKQ
jgi:hypothetical protein